LPCSCSTWPFDLAGTTVVDDHRVQAAFLTTARAYDLPCEPAQLQAYMGWHKQPVFETLLRAAGRPTELTRTMAARFEQEFAASNHPP
jgi:beta-phosphoglucomutase-like phosphatase (HAD superfamily)